MTERPIRPHPKPEPRAKSSPERPRAARISEERAFEIAVQALSWLATDPERLDRFLSLSGLDHESIRTAAQAPGFLGAVLEHLCADEESLLSFAAQADLRPETIADARGMLAGPSEWQSI